MPKDLPISEAEWTVMEVLWKHPALTAQEVIAHLQTDTEWAPATIKTMLHRLVQKGVVTYDREGNRYRYKAKLQRRDGIKRAGRSFLERVFGGQPGPLLMHFVQSHRLSASEIANLRKLLDQQEKKS